MGLGGEVRGMPHGLCASPLPLVLLGLGEVGAPPPLSLSPLENPGPTRIGGGGILLPEGVGLSGAPRPGRPAPPPWLLYIRGQGHPRNTQVDLRIVP